MRSPNGIAEVDAEGRDMHPQFRAPEYLAALMRGFDMGNDDELLGRDLPSLKRGVLLYRAERWQEAHAELSRSEGPSAQFLNAFCSARLETPQAALEQLPSAHDEDLDAATLAWGRGELLWANDELETAECQLATAASLGAALELTRLRYARGQFTEALESYALLGPEQPVLGALIQLALGDLEEARKELVSADRTQLDEARREPALKALELGQPVCRTQDGSWERLSEEESQLFTEQLRARYAGPWPLGIKWTEELWKWCQELTADAKVVAFGPHNGKLAGGDLSPALVEIGDALHLAPNLETPPPLWPKLEAEQVELALQSWDRTLRPRLSLPCRLRGFMGYREATFVPNPFTGEWQEASPHELDRHWSFSPSMDSYPWGGAYSDDPWRETIPPQPDLQFKVAARLDEVRQQAEGGISTFSLRTLSSRSQITTEYHPGGCYVWEIRYHPNPWPEVVAAFNSRLQVDYLHDLPLDVVSALYGFPCAPMASLWPSMEADREDSTALAGWFDVLAATGHNDLRTAYRLRQHLDHPDLAVRAALANVAVRYNWFFLLQDLLPKEKDEAFAAWLQHHYETGPPPPRLNEMGEPVE